MKKLSVLLVAMLCITFGAFSQVGTIKGNIKMKKTVNGVDTLVPLISATVSVTFGDQTVATLTDLHGDYTLKPLNPGTYNIIITHVQTDTLRVENFHVSGTDISFVKDLEVNEFKTIGGITVVADHTTIKAGIPSKSEMKREDLTRLPDISNINDIVTNLSSMVYKSERSNQVSFRGARMGDALYIVDGVPQRSTDVDVPNLSVNKVTAIYGGVPAKYGDFMGGVVEVETRGYFDWLNEQYIKELRIKQQNASTTDG